MDDNDLSLDELFNKDDTGASNFSNFDEALNEAFLDEGEFNEVAGPDDIAAPTHQDFDLIDIMDLLNEEELNEVLGPNGLVDLPLPNDIDDPNLLNMDLRNDTHPVSQPPFANNIQHVIQEANENSSQDIRISQNHPVTQPSSPINVSEAQYIPVDQQPVAVENPQLVAVKNPQPVAVENPQPVAVEMNDNDFNRDDTDGALNEAFLDEGELNEVSGSNDIAAPNCQDFDLIDIRDLLNDKELNEMVGPNGLFDLPLPNDIDDPNLLNMDLRNDTHPVSQPPFANNIQHVIQEPSADENSSQDIPISQNPPVNPVDQQPVPVENPQPVAVENPQPVADENSSHDIRISQNHPVTQPSFPINVSEAQYIPVDQQLVAVKNPQPVAVENPQPVAVEMNDNDFNRDDTDGALNEAFLDEGELNEVSGSNDIAAPNCQDFDLIDIRDLLNDKELNEMVGPNGLFDLPLPNDIEDPNLLNMDLRNDTHPVSQPPFANNIQHVIQEPSADENSSQDIPISQNPPVNPVDQQPVAVENPPTQDIPNEPVIRQPVSNKIHAARKTRGHRRPKTRWAHVEELALYRGYLYLGSDVVRIYNHFWYGSFLKDRSLKAVRQKLYKARNIAKNLGVHLLTLVPPVVQLPPPGVQLPPPAVQLPPSTEPGVSHVLPPVEPALHPAPPHAEPTEHLLEAMKLAFSVEFKHVESRVADTFTQSLQESTRFESIEAKLDELLTLLKSPRVDELINLLKSTKLDELINLFKLLTKKE